MLLAEALECLGGNGYVEESMLPRLYREAPLNSIWEGSGNINALDVLRAITKSPDALAVYVDELRDIMGEPAIASEVAVLQAGLRESSPAMARHTVERLALLWQYALLRSFSPQPIADAFYRSRITKEGGTAFGRLPRGVNLRACLERVGISEVALRSAPSREGVLPLRS